MEFHIVLNAFENTVQLLDKCSETKLNEARKDLRNHGDLVSEIRKQSMNSLRTLIDGTDYVIESLDILLRLLKHNGVQNGLTLPYKAQASTVRNIKGFYSGVASDLTLHHSYDDMIQACSGLLNTSKEDISELNKVSDVLSNIKDGFTVL